MQEGSWNNSAIWSITRARWIINDYKIFISKNYSNLSISYMVGVYEI